MKRPRVAAAMSLLVLAAAVSALSGCGKTKEKIGEMMFDPVFSSIGEVDPGKVDQEREAGLPVVSRSRLYRLDEEGVANRSGRTILVQRPNEASLLVVRGHGLAGETIVDGLLGVFPASAP
ncbi:MAG: hypothetical protein ACYTG4_09510 [Planctomycetota bacterium]|jgi:hypothetical protein